MSGIIDPDEADRYVDVRVVKTKERTLTLPEVKPKDGETVPETVGRMLKESTATAVEATAPEDVDAEREGLLTSLEELWTQLTAAKFDCADNYGMRYEQAIGMGNEGIADLVAMMSDEVISESAR